MESANEKQPAPVPHVLKAIGEMTELCAKEGIAKTRQGEHNYKFRGIDDIRNFVAPRQSECHLIIYPEVTGSTEKERTTKNGGLMLHVRLKLNMHFRSTRDGSEVVVPIEAEALDSGDKATSKAISQGFRNACINTFNIPTEGEKDTEEEKHQDLRGSKRMAHESREACDKFVHDYLDAVNKQATRHGLKDVGTVHALTLKGMETSDDEHERMAYGICLSKHQEALEELKRKEGDAAKARPQTVSSAKKGADDGN